MSRPAMRDIESRVMGVVAVCLGLETADVALGDRLADDLGAGSVELIDLAFRLEEEFRLGVDLAVAEVASVPGRALLREALTVGQLAEAVFAGLARPEP